ncbi:MAG: dienelactone hydrolase family protein [bacterium]|nr:dienelactone hydrolase family protein [bacterium]
MTIAWSGGTVSGRWACPRHPSGRAVLLAHGTGAGQDHPGVTTIRDGLVARGHPVLTFNYPYTEAGRRFPPDRRDVLLACHRAAAEWLRARFPGIVMAGRSMGGRMASYLAAAGEPCSGLVLYAYPLHPAGKPDRLRADHLPVVGVPMLFFTGSRDALALPHLVDRWLAPLDRATIEIIPDADHSFRVPKRSGRSFEQVMECMVARTSDWMSALVVDADW